MSEVVDQNVVDCRGVIYCGREVQNSLKRPHIVRFRTDNPLQLRLHFNGRSELFREMLYRLSSEV